MTDPSKKEVIWFTWSRGPSAQSRRGPVRMRRRDKKYIWYTASHGQEIYRVNAMNVKIIFEWKATCRCHRITPLKNWLRKTQTMALTPAVQHEFFYSFGDSIWRRHVAFPSKIILISLVHDHKDTRKAWFRTRCVYAPPAVQPASTCLADSSSASRFFIEYIVSELGG